MKPLASTAVRRSTSAAALAAALAAVLAVALAGCGDNLEPPPAEEACASPGDEDGDGLADCDDSDCDDHVACQAVCGNGLMEMGEGCDDGNTVDTDACTAACQPARCGDGIEQAGVEDCDDGNTVNTDACTSSCEAARCGDGVVHDGVEACDDGNMTNTDACTNACQAARCGDGIMGPGEACDDGNQDNTDGCTNACALPTCGDGFMQAGEQCDDGNMVDTDACLNTCMTAVCGDGVLRDDATVTEECDDGDAMGGDGCGATCAVEEGFTCTMAPSVCTTTCGDGIIAGLEACDQGGGNVMPGDGCDASCATEMGWLCTGEPSVCTNTCGNGTLDAGEQCDDGNMGAGDGCNVLCQFDIGCAAGETQVAVTNDDDFPIEDLVTINSPVTLASAQVISSMVVFVDISHTFDADVDMHITGPRMITRELSTDNGSGGDHFRYTYFDDRAATSITVGTPPYTGRFRPEQSLSAGGFRGQAATGTWTLDIRDDASALEGTLHTWSLIACVSAAVPLCGNGMTDAGEECDDGNDVVTDACNNSCGLTAGCGNGIVDTGEECDDDNLVSNDGCSAACAIEIACPTGQVGVMVGDPATYAIPDNDLVNGVKSTVVVNTTGAIVSARVFLQNITHPNDTDIDMYLDSPGGIRRRLADDVGSTGDNFISTLFDDSAAVAITAGTVPFSGSFRPEETLSTTVGTDLQRLRADGTWTLRVFDDLANNAGTLTGWKLLLCVDPAATYCGDGIINGGEECDDGNNVNTDACNSLCRIGEGCGDGNLDAGETCDDDNITAGDGCSATCAPELTCAAGETRVVVSNTMQVAIPDNDQVNGASSSVTVPTDGAITKAQVYLASLTHLNDIHLDIYLDSSRGVRRELSTDNGSSGDHYYGTIFDDAAATAITSASAPMTGRFRPEQSLSTAQGTDNLRQDASGTWTLRVFDDTSGTTGTLDNWSLLLCVDEAAPYCGDGMVQAGEECDDDNTIPNDACNNTCGVTDGCGDGNLDGNEQCDDDNQVSGDGCSAACMSDIGCAAGETPVVLQSNPATSFTDNNIAGLVSSITVPNAGLVRRTIVTVRATHGNVGHVDFWLMSARGGQRDLSTDNGGTGQNYTQTIFTDDASRAINVAAEAVAPFTGAFRPEQSLDVYDGQQAQGDWLLRFADDTSGTGGTLDSWTLALCIDPGSPVACGNGIVETGETCDDGNTAAGDGCSMVCQVELSCGAGEMLVLVTSADEKTTIPDTNTTGFTSTINVAAAGTVTDTIVVVNALGHTFAADVDMSLIAPDATAVELSTDNGSSGDDYLATMFSDASTRLISAATAATDPPFTGLWRPEGMLSTLDGKAAAGAWGLKIVDDATGDSGPMRTWTLGLCVLPPPP